MNEQERMQVLINTLKDIGYFDDVFIHCSNTTLRTIARYLSAFIVSGEMDSNRNPCKELMDNEEEGITSIENGNLAKVMIYLFPRYIPD